MSLTRFFHPPSSRIAFESSSYSGVVDEGKQNVRKSLEILRAKRSSLFLSLARRQFGSDSRKKEAEWARAKLTALLIWWCITSRQIRQGECSELFLFSFLLLFFFFRCTFMPFFQRKIERFRLSSFVARGKPWKLHDARESWKVRRSNALVNLSRD